MIIDREQFAEECVRQGAIFGVNPHYLLGVAQMRSGISDEVTGDLIGPFQLSALQWAANSNDDEFDIHFTVAQIGSAARQCAVFGLMTHRAFDAFASDKGRNPSAVELYLSQWPDGNAVTMPAALQKALDDTAPLIEPAAKAVLDDPETVQDPITQIDQTTDRPVPPLGTEATPQWYQLASREIGTQEEGDNSGEAIARYRRLAQCGEDHDPWCAIFVNAMLALCTPPVPGTRSASSQSFRDDAHFVKLTGPALGALAVFWRISPRSGKGHVGFYRGETGQSVYVLGGNEGDMVQIAPMLKNQLRGYWWPASLPLPSIAAIVLPPGTKAVKTKVT